MFHPAIRKQNYRDILGKIGNTYAKKFVLFTELI